MDDQQPVSPDDSGPSTAVVLRFGPDRRLTAAFALAAVIAALAAVATSDPAGRVLLGAAALLLAAYAVTDLIFNPRLTASRDGLVLHAPFARARLSWDEIESLGADVRTRYGLRSTTLEVDAGPVLALFSRRALGTDPDAAAGLLRALDPRPGSERGGGQADGGEDDDQHPGQPL